MSETAKAAGERGIRPPSASGDAASGASDRTVSGPRIRAAKSKIDAVVLVCAKCQKRQGMPKRTVRDLLKRGLKRGHPKRKLRIVETGCLGPCPKRALAVATGASLAARRILLLDPAATPDEAVAAVLSDFSPKVAPAPSAGAAVDGPVDSASEIPAGRSPGA